MVILGPLNQSSHDSYCSDMYLSSGSEILSRELSELQSEQFCSEHSVQELIDDLSGSFSGSGAIFPSNSHLFICSKNQLFEVFELKNWQLRSLVN